jgi:hypothetical protein
MKPLAQQVQQRDPRLEVKPMPFAVDGQVGREVVGWAWLVHGIPRWLSLPTGNAAMRSIKT